MILEDLVVEPRSPARHDRRASPRSRDGQFVCYVKVAGGGGILVRAGPTQGVGACRQGYGVHPKGIVGLLDGSPQSALIPRNYRIYVAVVIGEVLVCYVGCLVDGEGGRGVGWAASPYKHEDSHHKRSYQEAHRRTNILAGTDPTHHPQPFGEACLLFFPPHLLGAPVPGLQVVVV
jgi:hypothetical protein